MKEAQEQDNPAVESKTPTFDTLSLKQKQFIVNYIERRVAWKAYQDAYSTVDKPLSKESCDVAASEFLRKGKFRDALQEKMNSYWTNRDEAIGRMYNELETLAYSDVSNYIDTQGNVLNNFNGIDTRAIKSITITETESGTTKKIELHSKQAAISELTDILGLKKKAGVSITDAQGQTIKVEYV